MSPLEQIAAKQTGVDNDVEMWKSDWCSKVFHTVNRVVNTRVLELFLCGNAVTDNRSSLFTLTGQKGIIVNCMRIKSAKKFGICPEVFCIKWESREILTIYPETEDRR